MNITSSIRSIAAILVAISIFTAAKEAAAQTRTGGTGQTTGGTTGQTGGTGQTVGAGQGAQAIGSNAPSGAVTGQIGRSSDRLLQDVGTTGTTGGAGGLSGLGGLGGGRGFGGFGGLSSLGLNPFGTSSTTTTKPTIRTRLVNGVEPISAVMGQTTVAAGVPRQMVSVPVSKIVNGYSIAVVDGVATLSGVAKSAKDRRMAELVLKLEPGVDKIDNRIVVAP